MFDLGEVCVGVAVVDESVEKFRCFPNGLLTFLQAEVLLFLFEHVIERLIFVIQSIEFRHARRGSGVIHTEFFLGLAFLISPFEELIPFIEVDEWSVARSAGYRFAHCSSPLLIALASVDSIFTLLPIP